MHGVPKLVEKGLTKVKRMENERTGKRQFLGVCAGSHSVGRPQKRWIDTGKDCLGKTGLDVWQAWRMVQNRNEWRRFVKGNAWGVALGMNPRP